MAVTESSQGSKSREGMAEAVESGTICPMCGGDVPEDAKECPKCGEPFMPDAIESKDIDKGAKRLFWLGLIMAIIGGPGVALGSWIHDFLRIPIGSYDNFESFGWVNQLVSIVGIIILVIGIIFLIISLSKMEKEEFEDMEPIDRRKDEEQGG